LPIIDGPVVVSAGSRREAGGPPQFQTPVAFFHLGGDNTHNRNGALMLEKARELLNMGSRPAGRRSGGLSPGRPPLASGPGPGRLRGNLPGSKAAD